MGKRIPYVKPPAIGYSRPIAQVEGKSERDKFYAGSRWRKLRASFLRSYPFCARCEKDGKLVPAHAVHHVKERLVSPDLAFDWDNLESLCDACHTREHNWRRKHFDP